MTLGGKRKASFYVFTRIDQMWNQRTLWINRGYITFEWVLKIRKFLFTKTYTFTCKHRQPAGNPRIELKLLRITFNCWGNVGWTVRIHILAIVWPTPFLKLNFLPLNHILQQISDIKFVWTCFRLWMNNLLHCCITSVLAMYPGVKCWLNTLTMNGLYYFWWIFLDCLWYIEHQCYEHSCDS